jgi:DNA-binding FadR family transcriptional regulator
MPRPPVKAQELADELAARIRAGELAAGSWLPAERQLAAAHHVVRSVARQALHMLGSIGMAEQTPGSGWRVAGDLDTSDVRAELLAIRDRLDRINARLVAIEQRTESAG